MVSESLKDCFPCWSFGENASLAPTLSSSLPNIDRSFPLLLAIFDRDWLVWEKLTRVVNYVNSGTLEWFERP